MRAVHLAAVRISLALLVAPILALADESVALALTGWTCSHQTTTWLHLSHAFFFALTAGTVVLAWRTRRDACAPSIQIGVRRQIRFLAGAATSMAILSAVAIAAMWMPTAMISSCVA